MRLEHHLVGGYVRYISPHIIIIIIKVLGLPQKTSDVGDLLSNIHKEEKYNNRQMLLKIISNIRFLARQGKALWGESKNQEGEVNSNFMQLYYLRGQENPQMLDWIKRKSGKYMSGDMQNEVLQVMAEILSIPPWLCHFS